MKKNKLLNTFSVAFHGIYQLVRTERNFQIHSIALFVVTGLGCWLQITTSEWIDILLVSTIVLALEAINTAIEKLCDLVEPNYHPQIKWVKDLAAAGVLIGAMAAVIVGLLVFTPYF